MRAKKPAAVELTEIDINRQLLTGICAREAKRILEESGALNSEDSESFGAAIYRVDKANANRAEQKLQKMLSALLKKPPASRHEIFEIDSLHNNAMMNRGLSAYLLGVAVGLQIGRQAVVVMAGGEMSDARMSRSV